MSDESLLGYRRRGKSLDDINRSYGDSRVFGASRNGTVLVQAQRRRTSPGGGRPAIPLTKMRQPAHFSSSPRQFCRTTWDHPQVMDHRFQTTDLTKLPERLGEVWQVHVGYHPRCNRWCLLAVSATTDSFLPNDLIVFYDLVKEFPSSELIWEMLRHAMLNPRRRRAHRPSTIQFGLEGYRDALRTQMEAAGISASCNRYLRCWESVFVVLLAPPPNGMPASLFCGPGVTSDGIKRFFASAACFHEHIPYMPEREVIRVSRDGRKGKWYGLIRRGESTEPSLTLVESDSFSKNRFSSLADMVRHSVSLRVSFGAPGRLPDYDLQAIESNEWPVASENGYPLPLRSNPGGVIRAPLGWELEMLEQALHIIPGMLILQRRTKQRQACHRAGVADTHPLLEVTIGRRSDELRHDG